MNSLSPPLVIPPRSWVLLKTHFDRDRSAIVRCAIVSLTTGFVSFAASLALPHHLSTTKRLAYFVLPCCVISGCSYALQCESSIASYRLRSNAVSNARAALGLPFSPTAAALESFAPFVDADRCGSVRLPEHSLYSFIPLLPPRVLWPSLALPSMISMSAFIAKYPPVSQPLIALRPFITHTVPVVLAGCIGWIAWAAMLTTLGGLGSWAAQPIPTDQSIAPLLFNASGAPSVPTRGASMGASQSLPLSSKQLGTEQLVLDPKPRMKVFPDVPLPHDGLPRGRLSVSDISSVSFLSALKYASAARTVRDHARARAAAAGLGVPTPRLDMDEVDAYCGAVAAVLSSGALSTRPWRAFWDAYVDGTGIPQALQAHAARRDMAWRQAMAAATMEPPANPSRSSWWRWW